MANVLYSPIACPPQFCLSPWSCIPPLTMTAYGYNRDRPIEAEWGCGELQAGEGESGAGGLSHVGTHTEPSHREEPKATIDQVAQGFCVS